MIKKIILLVLLTISLYSKQNYTVDELILQALKNSPDLAISSAKYEASKSRYDVAFSDYLPKVDLSIGAGFYGISDVINNPNEMIDDEVLVGSLSLKQLIYDFGKTGGNNDKFMYDSKAFFSDNQQQISNKKLEVKSAYYVVLNSIAQIKVNTENVKLNKIQLYRSQKYFEAGIRTKIDVSDAKVEFIKSKLALRNSEYDLKLSYASLDKVIGYKDNREDYEVYSKDLDLENIYSSLKKYSLTLKDAIKYAYENRDEIKRYMLNLKSVQASSKLITSQYYPELFFNAQYTKQYVDELENQTPEDKWLASVNLNWNIYQGGSTSAKEQENRMQINISASELQNIKLSIKKDVTQAYINVNKNKDAVELSQNLLEVSKEKFDQAQKRYEHGLSDYIELQQARQGYIDSMSSLVIDYYSYYNAIAALDNAIGK